jgi:hypothetical protein
MPEWPYITEAQDLPDGQLKPYKEPESIVAGDTALWRRAFEKYPASQGWSLRYSLRGIPGAGSDFASQANGDEHLVIIPGATTADWPPGKYRIQGYAENLSAVPIGAPPGTPASSLRYTIYSGYLVIRGNLAATDPEIDLRSHAQICVDNIEAVLQGRATSDVLESEIEGTKIARIPVKDLLLFRDRYLAEIESQNREARAKEGRATGRTIFARFTPVGR